MNLKKILKLLLAPVIGFLVMTIPMFLLITSLMTPSIMSTEAPGSATFEITEPGTYGVWRQLAGVVSDSEFRSDSESLPEGLSLHIKIADTGATVPLVENLGVTSTSNGSSRASLVNASLEPGRYILVSEAIEPTTLVVRESGINGKLFLSVFILGMLGFFIMLGGVVYAMASIIRGALKTPKPEVPEA